MKLALLESLATTLLLSPLCRVRGQGTDLGGGVVTRTDVEYFADTTLDVRDIKQSIDGGNNNGALQIYLGGRNSGRDVGDLFKLTQLSTDLANEPIAKVTPIFLFQLYGLGGRSMDINYLSGNGAYADSYVRSAIQNGRWTASTAALVLNVWMYAADVLYKGVNTCQKKTEADNPSQFDIGGGGLDEFIALWIGSGQTHGSSEGFGLYALTEKADRLFVAIDDTNDPLSINKSLAESRVNQQLKLLYQEGASLFSMPDVCTKENPDTPKNLWSIINRINTQMYIPLMQMLIVSILEQDVLATHLYATAVVPQAAQCRPSVYDRLSEELLEGEPNFQRTEFILADLLEIYSCFGISCSDIGMVAKNYEDFSVPACLAARNNAPMALYKPDTDVQPVRDATLSRSFSLLDNFRFLNCYYGFDCHSYQQFLFIMMHVIDRKDRFRCLTNSDLDLFGILRLRQILVPLWPQFPSTTRQRK
jgi:hypothetical protein